MSPRQANQVSCLIWVQRAQEPGRPEPAEGHDDAEGRLASNLPFLACSEHVYSGHIS